MDIKQQKEAIHSMARGNHMQKLKWFSIVLSVILMALGLYTRQPPYFMFLILPLLVAYSAHQTGPHVRSASKAIRSGSRSSGQVIIEVDSSSDSDKYHATVAGQKRFVWRFEFIPLGWKPVAGQFSATLHTLRGLDWPALIEVENGVMYPRDTPTRSGNAKTT